MPSSGSVDFSVSRDEIIKGALRAAKIIGKDQTPDSSHISTGAEALNLIVKQWQGRADFGANLKVWSRKTAYLFLQSGQSVYSLGPSGDHWASSYSSTTVSAAEAAGQNVISVVSTTGMTAADQIGIELDSGSIHWTTIVSMGAGPTVTITTVLPSAAAAGKRVFWYTTTARRPLQLLTAVLRDTNTIDQPLPVNMTRQDYEALPDKTGDGDPVWVAYEATLTNGTLYLNCEPSDVTKVIRIVFLGTIEDFDALADTPDYPQEWFRALKYQLAMDLYPEYREGDIPISLKLLRDESLSIAQNTDPETSDAFFEPGRE
jgi:hypothetical protein